MGIRVSWSGFGGNILKESRGGTQFIWKLMTNGKEGLWTVGTFLMLEKIVDTFTGKFGTSLEGKSQI